MHGDSSAGLPVIKLRTPRYYLIDAKGECGTKLYKTSWNAEKRIQDRISYCEERIESERRWALGHHVEMPEKAPEGKTWIQVGEEEIVEIRKRQAYWQGVTVQELK